MRDLPPQLAALLDAARSLARSSASYRLLEGHVPDPLSAKEVEQALKAAWGRAPGKVLDDLEAEPARRGPVSQVHRASLDGEDVAVEVQRPGIATQVRNDLVLLDALAGPAHAAFPKLNPGAMIREARERVLDELDLEHQASVQRAVRRAARGDDRLVVPAPVGELCEAGVKVEAWLDGTPAGAEHAELLVELCVGLAVRDAWVVVDHRPEHVLALPEGRLGLLSAGTSVRVDRDRLRAWAAAARGVVEDDAAPIAELGAVGDHERAHRIAREAGAPFLEGPVRLDLAALRATAERAVAAGAPALAGDVTPVPDDLWPGRGIGQLVLTLAAWGPTADWPAVGLQALERAGA